MTIGVLDAGIDATHPAIKGSIIAARDFSGSGTADDDRRGVGHATGIAGFYVGHASDYVGLTPQARVVNARVINDRDYTDDTMAGRGLFHSINNGAKVLNFSFGNKLGDGPLTSKFNLMADYAAEQYGVSFVAAAGNDDDTAVNQTPAGAYNGFAVGALAPSRYNQVSSFSNFAMRSDRRTKPDIVAPGQSVQRATSNWENGGDYALGSGTSFATPVVGGLLAQMVGYGQDRGLPTDPHLLKAVTLTSAAKVYDSSGTPWAPRAVTSDKRRRMRVTAPLDDEQGAGRVDAVAAYNVYAKRRDAGTTFADWTVESLKRLRVSIMDLGRVSKGQRVDATLAWYRHVGRRDDGDGAVDEGDRYFETSALANFALMLLKDGKIVATSDSAYDNVEQLSIRIKNAGNYSLQVYRGEAGGERYEDFAMAARVLANPPTLSQIDPVADAFTASSVKRGFGDPTSVPEPGAVGVVVAGVAMMLGRRRRA